VKRSLLKDLPVFDFSCLLCEEYGADYRSRAVRHGLTLLCLFFCSSALLTLGAGVQRINVRGSAGVASCDGMVKKVCADNLTWNTQMTVRL